jgi:hypothetical protein
MKTKVIHIAFDGNTFETPQHAKDHEKRVLVTTLLAEQLRPMFASSEFPDRVRAEPAQLAAHVAEHLGAVLVNHAILAWKVTPGVRGHLRQLIEQLGGDANDLSLEG